MSAVIFAILVVDAIAVLALGLVTAAASLLGFNAGRLFERLAPALAIAVFASFACSALLWAAEQFNGG